MVPNPPAGRVDRRQRAAARLAGLACGSALALLIAGLILLLASPDGPLPEGYLSRREQLINLVGLLGPPLLGGLLTALLAAVYAGIVLVLGQGFGGVGGNPPSWAVAGATLAVAALFQPARRRVQAVVDRRFNRRKYNAAKTVAAFSLRLREEVDLDALSAELLAVVDQTVQPTRASLWLRSTNPTHGRRP